MAKKKSKQKIFNDRPRKVFRKKIYSGEVIFSTVFVGIVVLMAVWFIAQHDNYDPGERDISMEVMLASSVEDNLYEPPLKLWVDPAKVQAGGAAPAIDIGIMPPVILEDGWIPGGRLEQFDNSNLYEKINGQETQYKGYGFQYLHYISIEHPEEELYVNIEIYDMGEFSNAFGVFAAQRSAGTTLEPLGSATYYETEAGGIGLVDNFYLKFSGSESSPIIRELARKGIEQFAKLHAANAAPPRPMILLSDKAGVDIASMEYGKEDVFQYSFAKDFWFGKTGDSEFARYFIHEAASAEDAQALRDQIVEEHSYDYSVVDKLRDAVILQHDFLKTYFAIATVDELLVGVERAETEDEVAAAITNIQQAVGEDVAAESSEESYDEEFVEEM